MMLKKLIFSKANSLKYIQQNLGYKIIPNFVFFTKQDYTKKKKYLLAKIKKNFKEKIIVRSSALNEDTNKTSSAGQYDSFYINKITNYNLDAKINKVIEKFKNINDQIIVQRFITNPEISGVVFTKDINTNSDYYQIEYDTSKRTDLVTSGNYNPSLKSLIIFKQSQKIPTKFIKLIKTCKLLENLFLNSRLDIEFCIKDNKLFILQCRPLLGNNQLSNINNHKQILINLKKKFQKLNLKVPQIFGEKTILSNMSDWNPAEIIGSKPGNLAISLYSELITNSIWSEQRFNYGYKDVRPNSLMIDLAGSPYIDLRIDLNSFLPFNLNRIISKKIINHSINLLKKKPELHDKIEFEIIDTCYNFSLDRKKFSFLKKSEKILYIKKLKDLTNNILNPKNFYLENEIKKNKILIDKIKYIQKSKLSHIQKIFYLIYDCKKFGTLPFAGIARCAFISKSIIDSLYNLKLLNVEDIEKFNLSLKTISKDVNNDFIKGLKKKILLNLFKNMVI